MTGHIVAELGIADRLIVIDGVISTRSSRVAAPW